MAGATFRGVSLEQDKRYKDKEEKEIRKRSFPSNFEQKVDSKKLKLEVIQSWLAKRITLLMNGIEDEFIFNYVAAMLEAERLDPRKMQINLIAFMGKKAAPLMAELWTLLIDAQANGGVPRQLVQATKDELTKRREESARIRGDIAASEKKEVEPAKPESWIPPSFDAIQKEKEERRRVDRRRSRSPIRPHARSRSPPRIRRSRSRSPVRVQRRNRSRSPVRHGRRDEPIRSRRQNRSRSRSRSPRRERGGGRDNRKRSRSRSPPRPEKKVKLEAVDKTPSEKEAELKARLLAGLGKEAASTI